MDVGTMASGETRKTVVIVDDSEDIREYLEVVCATDGWRAILCADADEGFAAVKRERPDLLITDVALGISNGLDLITHLRSDLSPPLPPIIVISGFDRYESEAVARGADAFVPKPFDWDTMRATIATVMGHESVGEAAREEAFFRSQTKRSEALEAAHIAVARMRNSVPLSAERGSWAVKFLARYIGFGEAVIALLGNGTLRVTSSTNPDRWQRDDPFELPMCREVLETNSTLVVPDLDALAGRTPLRPRFGVRFLAGVPLRTGRLAIGILCLLSESAGVIDAEDLALLHYFARRASAVLTTEHPEMGPLFGPSGLVTRPALVTLVASELARARHEELALRILATVGPPPRLTLGARSAVAELGEDRHALFLSVPNGATAWHESLALAHRVVEETSPRTGILVSIEGDPLTAFNADMIVRGVETLLEQRVRRDEGGIAQIVIRRQPLESALFGAHEGESSHL